MITREDLEFSKMSYTHKDFASLYPDLLDLAKQLTNLWDPSSSNESDPGVVLLKEGAFIADHNNYNIDKNVLECFLPSATQETSVRNLVEMNGYVPRYYVSAIGNVEFDYKIPDDLTDEEKDELPTAFSVKPFTIQVSNEDGSVTYTQGPETLYINETGKNTNDIEFIEGTVNTLSVNGVSVITLDNLDDNNRLYFPVKYVAENGIFISNATPNGDPTYDFWKKEDYLLTKPLGSKVFKLDYDSRMGLPYIEFPSDIANIIEAGLTVRYVVSSGVNGNIRSGGLSKIISPANIVLAGDVKIPTEYITVKNPKSILNGKDPETLDEMYQSFKKVVHTFNTLVTCKDFQDAIYMLHDDKTYERYLGNDIVTDIKTDYNKSIRVASYDEYGSFVKNVSLTNGLGRLKFQSTKPENPEIGDIIIEDGILKWYTMDKSDDGEKDEDGNPLKHWAPLEQISYDDFVKASEAITPFDVCVYALRLFSLTDYDLDKPWVAIENSFLPIIGNDSEKLFENLDEGLKNLKCLNHQLVKPAYGDIICFKNYVPLYITVIPYSKVTYEERKEIFHNIYIALSEHFNSNELDFGQPLIYETVYDVVVNADERIKSIRLEDFDYHTKVMVLGSKDKTGTNQSNGVTEYDLLDDEEVGNYYFIDLVAKNILAGRISMFNVDDNFDYQYGQVNAKEYHGLKTITSEVNIPVESLINIVSQDDMVENPDEESSEVTEENLSNQEKSYQLSSNEFIQVAWPNYYSDVVYPTYVYYRFEVPSGGAIESRGVPADQEYTLRSGEKLTLVWTKNNNKLRKTYTVGDRILPNFNLLPTKETSYYTQTDSDGLNKKFDLLGSGQQIEHKVLLETILNGKHVPIYWITQDSRRLFLKEELNETTGQIVKTEVYDEILNSGEYFVYGNNNSDAMVIFGPGTKLHRRSLDDGSEWSIVQDANIEQLNQDGASELVSWKYRDFSDNALSIQEMNLLTLTTGDSISFRTTSDADAQAAAQGNLNTNSTISNEWQHFDGIIDYVVNVGGENESEGTLMNSEGYEIRSRLDMTSDKYHPQELLKGQSITIRTNVDDTPIVIDGPDIDQEIVKDSDRVYYQVNTNEDLLGDTSILLENITGSLSDYLSNRDVDLRVFQKEEPKIYNLDTGEVGGNIVADVAEGDYNITMEYKNGRAELPLAYVNSFDTLDVNRNEYIIPIFIDSSRISKEEYIPVDVWLENESSESSETYSLSHYGRPEIDVKSSEGILTLDKSGLHLLKIDVEGDWNNELSSEGAQVSETVELNANLKLCLEWHSEKTIDEPITVKDFKIVGGLNSNIPSEYASLSEVEDRISELMANSNDSDSIPYLTYDPEYSKAIQNEDLSDPNSLWDVNNVANPFTIAQIDIYTMCNEKNKAGTKTIGTIDIIKSMKDYRD